MKTASGRSVSCFPSLPRTRPDSKRAFRLLSRPGLRVRRANPALQGRKFDPTGEYVRRWVPELAGTGGDYPAPMIDHRAARQRALDAYAMLSP